MAKVIDHDYGKEKEYYKKPLVVPKDDCVEDPPARGPSTSWTPMASWSRVLGDDLVMDEPVHVREDETGDA